MNKLTNEQLEIVKAFYPELTSMVTRAAMDCSSRSHLPGMIRSMGKRPGWPTELEWVFTESPFRPPPGPWGNGNEELLTEILAELRKISGFLKRDNV